MPDTDKLPDYRESMRYQEIKGEIDSLTDEELAERVSHESITIERIPIWAGNQDIPVLSSQCWNAIVENNYPARIFVKSGLPIRLKDNGEVQILTLDRMKHELERSAAFFHYKTGKYNHLEKVPAKVPTAAASDMLAAPAYPLHEIKKIVAAPCFDKTGTLCLQKGYNGNGIYLKNDLQIPEIPPIDIAKTIIEDVIQDFTFETQADKANLYALIVLPFIRDLIPGPTPLHMIESSTPGTGKGLMKDLCVEISTGGECGHVVPSSDEDELRKRTTAILMQGVPVVCIDNAEDLSGATLASVLTAEKWTDRILGKSETITIPVQVVWIATGNNITLSTEIARRIVRIRLKAPIDRPWERQNFAHTHLLSFVKEHRAELQAACISIINNWIGAGKPRGVTPPFGSFEAYAETMSGILQNAGIQGFLENRNAVFDEADSESEAWRSLTSEWWEKHGTNKVKASDLFPIAQDTDGFALNQRTEEGKKAAFGKMLNKNRDRIFNDLRIIYAGTYRRAKVYALQKCEDVKIFRSQPPRVKTKLSESIRGETYTNPHHPHTDSKTLFDTTEVPE